MSFLSTLTAAYYSCPRPVSFSWGQQWWPHLPFAHSFFPSLSQVMNSLWKRGRMIDLWLHMVTWDAKGRQGDLNLNVNSSTKEPVKTDHGNHNVSFSRISGPPKLMCYRKWLTRGALKRGCGVPIHGSLLLNSANPSRVGQSLRASPSSSAPSVTLHQPHSTAGRSAHVCSAPGVHDVPG